MIYWFTGQPSSGKTTLAVLLVSYLESLGKKVKHIDGDGLRELTQNFDYSELGRRNNIQKAQEIALINQKEGKDVVVSLVAPYRDLREDLKQKSTVLEFFTHTTESRRKDLYKVKNYEEPLNDFTSIDTNNTIDECMDLVKAAIKRKNKYSMFVGRYQPLHDGHKWLFSQQLQKGRNVLICVRDMFVDDENPYSAEQVKLNIIKNYEQEVATGKVKVIIIPDIESINYGRGVGYEINEHQPSEKIGKISATEIRKNTIIFK